MSQSIEDVIYEWVLYQNSESLLLLSNQQLTTSSYLIIMLGRYNKGA